MLWRDWACPGALLRYISLRMPVCCTFDIMLLPFLAVVIFTEQIVQHSVNICDFSAGGLE